VATSLWFYDITGPGAAPELDGEVTPNEMRNVAPTSGTSVEAPFELSSVEFSDERDLGTIASGKRQEFWSQTSFGQHTVTNHSYEFSLWARVSDAAYNGRLRARFYKMTRSGVRSAVLCQADAAANLTTTTAQYTFSGPPISYVLAPGERMIVRITVVPQSGGFGAGTAYLSFGSTTHSSYCDAASLFFGNVEGQVTLFQRRTAVNGIGNFFDLLPDLGVTTETTGVVDTVAGSPGLPWTRAAGGAPLEWITPRFGDAWILSVATDVDGRIDALENNAQANASIELRFYRRKPDGTETLVLTVAKTTELTTSRQALAFTAANMSRTLAPGGPHRFEVDDRLVMKPYAVPLGGAMGGGRTCTLWYDTSSANLTAHVKIPASYSGTLFKSESEQASANVPGSGTMLGVSTGK
jgi:hypothetical protein